MTKHPATDLTPTVSIPPGECDNLRHTCNSPLSEGDEGATNPASEPARALESLDIQTHQGRTPADGETQIFHVYRFYGAGDELLYVGQSARLPRRLSQHRRDKEWWGEVERIELERCESRAAALKLERDLIAKHCPPFNVAQNPLPRTRQRAGRDPELEVCDVRCCPCCGAPELLLEFVLRADLRWSFADGQPDEFNPPTPDSYVLDEDELEIGCRHCGDRFSVIGYTSDEEAMEFYERVGWLRA